MSSSGIESGNVTGLSSSIVGKVDNEKHFRSVIKLEKTIK